MRSVRHEHEDAYSFARLCEMAAECSSFPSRVDVNDDLFLAPDSMTEAIQEYCRKTGQIVPTTMGEVSAVIYQSLADCYGKTAVQLKRNTGKEYDGIFVVGGGSNAAYLNQLTADASGMDVYAGPGEATAVGNIMAQMLRGGELENLAEARKCVAGSFDISHYQPQNK